LHKTCAVGGKRRKKRQQRRPRHAEAGGESANSSGQAAKGAGVRLILSVLQTGKAN
jgi:hypothetical protein